MNTSIINFNYKGSEISFMSGGNVMVNATQMAKPFGKRPIDYLRLPSTNELINAIVRKSHISEKQIVITKQGSTDNGGGTWLYEDIALDFAQWLSVDFRLWCNDRIKELLKYGMTATQPTLEQIINNPDLIIKLASELKQERAEKALLAEQNRLNEEQIKLAAPKVQYFNDTLQSANTYTSTQMSKELGLREAEQLHKLLKKKGIMFKQSGQWMLTAKYCGKGYTKPRTNTFTRSDGSTGTNTITVWTETGRAFLHSIFKAN